MIKKNVFWLMMFTLPSFAQNMIYIDQQSGSANNAVTIEQSGGSNLISGATSQYAVINGQNNTLYVNQGGSTLVDTLQMSLVGNSNILSINQGYIVGNSLNLNVKNIGDLGGHLSTINVLGNSNTITVQQTGTASHTADINLTGNSNSVTLVQDSIAPKTASITAINAGGASNNITVSQTGATAAGVAVSQTCVTGSCNVAITQIK